MAASRKADVEIFGKTYTLVSDQSDDYAREVAREVDRRMAQIATEKNLADTTKIAMMAAMEIADELMKARREGARRRSDAEAACRKLETIVREAGG